VIQVGNGPHEAVIAPSGTIAVVTVYHVADVATRKVVWTLDGLGSPRGVNIAPDGRTAVVTLAADETMGVIDLEARKLTRKVKVEKSPDGVWFGPVPR
jgi:DNA-binding beta-propeller fold protein YncE